MVSIPRYNFEELVLEEYWEFCNNFWCVGKVCSSGFVFCNFGLSILPVVYSIIANKTKKSCLLVCYRYHYFWYVAIVLQYQNHTLPNRKNKYSSKKRTNQKYLISFENDAPKVVHTIQNCINHTWLYTFFMIVLKIGIVR